MGGRSSDSFAQMSLLLGEVMSRLDELHKNPNAVKYDHLTYDEFLARDLKVADATAISLCSASPTFFSVQPV